MTRASGLYEGFIRHRRFHETRHDLRMNLFMMYLDLDELPDVLDGTPFFSARRPAPAWFRRKDYLRGNQDHPSLKEAVRARVEEVTGERPRGPVRILTHLRMFGIAFNPVSIYYVFAEDGRTLECLVAEITNTPWRERHAYVVPAGDMRSPRVHRHRMRKVFHVSPFHDMDHLYEWRWTVPGDRLVVHMENHRDGQRLFDATLSLSRREITPAALNRALVRHPFLNARILAGIYAHAARLWWKGATFHPHPRKRRPAAAPDSIQARPR